MLCQGGVPMQSVNLPEYIILSEPSFIDSMRELCNGINEDGFKDIVFNIGEAVSDATDYNFALLAAAYDITHKYFTGSLSAPDTYKYIEHEIVSAGKMLMADFVSKGMYIGVKFPYEITDVIDKSIVLHISSRRTLYKLEVQYTDNIHPLFQK